MLKAISSFHDVRFPVEISLGAYGGPEWKNDILQLKSGYEVRNQRLSRSRRKYNVSTGIKSTDNIAEVVAFFEARRGSLFAFRWKDWLDYKSCPVSQEAGTYDQAVGIGDDSRTIYQLIKNYNSGVYAYTREILKPVHGSVSIAIADRKMELGRDYEVNYDNGQILFYAPPPKGASIFAGYQYDVPCRFASSSLSVSLSGFTTADIPEIEILEVFE